MKAILIPTDFSEQANNALDVAYAIAKKNNASIKLLHIIEAPGVGSFNTMGEVYTGDPMNNVYIMEMMKVMKGKMEMLISDPKYKDVEMKYNVKVGNAFSGISNEINEFDIDLVVMGSKGSSGLEETLIGSNTEKVVRRAKCPVLTVKDKMDMGAVKNIVFASDFRTKGGNVIAALKEFATTFDAKIHLLKVNTPNSFSADREMRKRMNEFAMENRLENYTINIYNHEDEEDGIIYFADDINADIIALGTHGRTGLMHLLSGSIAEDIVNHARRPVWTYRIAD